MKTFLQPIIIFIYVNLLYFLFEPLISLTISIVSAIITIWYYISKYKKSLKIKNNTGEEK